MDAIQKAIKIIMHWEGLRLAAYKPLPTDPWTIGYGATGPDIKQGTVWTKEKSEEDLKKRVTVLYTRIHDVLPNLGVNEYAALVSFCYNVGFGAFMRSTMFDLLVQNKKPKKVIAQEFNKYIYAGGVKIQGLINRRKQEQDLFLKED